MLKHLVIKGSLIIFTMFSVSGCSSTPDDYYVGHTVEQSLESARQDVEQRERHLPNEYKSNTGNGDDIKNGLKRTRNKNLLVALMALLSDAP